MINKQCKTKKIGKKENNEISEKITKKESTRSIFSKL